VYGVPKNLDLNFLHDSELSQICLGVYQVQFHFSPEGIISVEGEWELLSRDGIEIDRSAQAPRANAFQLHRLLGQRVVGSELLPPEWFALRFEKGEVLRVFDSSQDYESFSIQPGNIFI
jgi:hypothetical protein